MEVFHSRFSRVLAAVSIGILALSWFVGSVGLGVQAAIGTLPIVLLFSYLALIVFWLPKVSVEDDLVRISNIFREHTINLSAIKRIDTRFALTIYTATKKYSAWGAPAPGRHASIFASKDEGSHLPESTYLAGTVRPGDLINTDSGAAAAHIRRLWERRTDTENIETSKLYWPRVAALAALVLVSFLF